MTLSDVEETKKKDRIIMKISGLEYDEFFPRGRQDGELFLQDYVLMIS